MTLEVLGAGNGLITQHASGSTGSGLKVGTILDGELLVATSCGLGVGAAAVRGIGSETVFAILDRGGGGPGRAGGVPGKSGGRSLALGGLSSGLALAFSLALALAFALGTRGTTTTGRGNILIV